MKWDWYAFNIYQGKDAYDQKLEQTYIRQKKGNIS